MKREMCLLGANLLNILTPMVLRAADPVIHLQWDGGGTPVAGTNYTVDTTETGTPAFPDVKLHTGRSDWRIWSTDTDNAGGYGDIGEISCPASENFGVKIANQSNDFGARYIKRIHLVPTSTNNYSNITGGFFDGSLLEELIVQTNVSLVGGEITDDLSISGDVPADITIPSLTGVIYFDGDVSGDIAIEEVSGALNLHIEGLSGSANIGSVSGLVHGIISENGSLHVGDVESTGLVNFHDFLGTLQLEALHENATISFGQLRGSPGGKPSKIRW